ncbi:GNAT family N-acetyltransferase [Leifsonia sp. NPDC014704]|uniref:GNAT family N-acetyltransferase n=1 Tax=Leifsonia sp. NPDC014704 TaxID=3364123 RepID=UPI0036F47B1A
MIAPSHQKRGFGSEAASAMCAWLTSERVAVIACHIHRENLPSIGIARKLGSSIIEAVLHHPVFAEVCSKCVQCNGSRPPP